MRQLRGFGRSNPSHTHHESGLFSDGPYHCSIEHQWLADQQAAIQTFTVTDDSRGNVKVFRSTARAWTFETLGALLQDVGFETLELAQGWPSHSADFELWIARKQ